MTVELQVGMQVKIIAPEGFDLDQRCNDGEWKVIHYLPDEMKKFVGTSCKIDELGRPLNGVWIGRYCWPVSWVVPLNSKKTQPKPSGKDFLGNVIQEGDQVVYARKGYRTFQVGKIMNITPTGTRILTGETRYDGSEKTFFQTFDQIVKKP